VTAVDAVIFDWGGTLTPWHTIDLHEQWAAYTRVYDPAHADELAGRLLAAENEAWTAAREHQQSGTLDELLRSAGIDPTAELHEQALAAYQEFWTPHTLIDPDAPPLLRALRERGIKVGVLSNTLWPREYHEVVFRRDGVLDLIDGAVYSSEIAWTKPHPEAFRAAMTAVGVAEPASRGVRRRPPLRRRARREGGRHARRPRAAQRDPARPAGHVEGDPDAVVQRLGDLLAIIDGWNAGRSTAEG
jgi:putative hydrolase of the HAD superfamily